MKLRFRNDTSEPMDAHYETPSQGVLILHSRSGTKGKPRARNTEYGPAFRLLLKRIRQSNLNLDGIWIDSARVQDIPLEERRIFPKTDNDAKLAPKKLFTELSSRMAEFGQTPGSQRRSNPNRRLRFVFAGHPSEEQIISIVGEGHVFNDAESPVAEDGLTLNEEVPTSPDDRTWIEGQPQRVTHLRRERKPGLSAAKKAAFRKEHGKLQCEHCGLDPVETYGSDAGEACIEVHHTVPLSKNQYGLQTLLEDLECLCANCHRVVHRKLRLSDV